MSGTAAGKVDPTVLNPFRVTDTQSEPVYEGRISAEEIPDFGPGGVETIVAAAGVSGSAYSPVMKLSGVLWEPPLNSVLQLGEPGRDATIVDRFYMVVPGRLSSVVCVDDPITSSRANVA